MVAQDARLAVEGVLRRWVDALPRDVASLRVWDEAPERVIAIVPSRVGAASLNVRVAAYGEFSIYAGRGFGVDECRDMQLLVEVSDSISRGRLKERLRWFGRWAVSATASLVTSRRTITSSYARIWLPAVLTRIETIEYAPWV